MQHVFLSYCREDSDLMNRVRDDLNTGGLSVWTDEGIELDTTSWKREIENNILAACCLVAILSPEAAKSDWVRAELDYAEFQGKPIFIILGRGDERKAIIFGFVAAQRVDIRDEKHYQTSINKLISTIKKRCSDLQAQEAASVLRSPAPPVTIHPLLVSNGTIALPSPFEWCAIPEGTVTLADASQRYPPGTKGGIFHTENFAIGKYPITNAQYQVFLDATNGYNSSQWWDFSEIAKQWRRAHPTPEETAFLGADLPRTKVTWFEALAFCRWLSERIGQSVTLPTEVQWQRAAQGDTGFSYPWGDGFYSYLCNINQRIGQPTPVTRYPDGASPYGVFDMSGNVWNWCLTNWLTGDAMVQSNDPRVVRAGAWYTGDERALVAWRDAQSPDFVHPGFGFRICKPFV